MLASKNLPKPITKPSEGYQWIRVLAAELALRLNDARQISPNLWPKTLALHARKGECCIVILLAAIVKINFLYVWVCQGTEVVIQNKHPFHFPGS